MLPYKNVEEAEAAIGRELSIAEKLYLKYTADKPDHYLHSLNILFLFLFYTLLPIPYILIEHVSGNKYKIQPKVTTSSKGVFKCYKYVLSTFLLVAAPLQLITFSHVKVIIY